MTVGGWVMLVATWAFILALNVFCFVRLFTEKPANSAAGEDESRDT